MKLSHFWAAIDTEESPGLETSLHNSLSVGSECLEPPHQMLHTSLVVWFKMYHIKSANN